MYSNKTLNFQESRTILNGHTKNVWELIVCTSYNSGPISMYFISSQIISAAYSLGVFNIPYRTKDIETERFKNYSFTTTP